jgi:hypothetical protein
VKIEEEFQLPFEYIRKLPELDQVLLRLRKMRSQPGHRVFLRELADRLEKLVQGKLKPEDLVKGGWSMGQYGA